MRILVLNSGSSSIKFQYLEASAQGAPRRLAKGAVMRLGPAANYSCRVEGAAPIQEDRPVADHEAAVRLALAHLPGAVEAVGHRVVHGGQRFTAPTLLDEEAVAAIAELATLAPLHNPAALMGIRAAQAALGPGVPMVAVFDTAFHHTLPPQAHTYALPWELAERHGLRRYGFHGTAHRYLALRTAQLLGRPLDQVNLVTFQLGNGCSATAVEKGRSVETSMGFTPLEGLVMGTRSGDVDPALIPYLVQRAGLSIDQVDTLFNKRSGLLGLSGVTNDMAGLEELMHNGHARARLAVEVFCHRARKYLGAYLAVLGRVQAVALGGGIGENSPLVRALILGGLEGLGLELDETANQALTRAEGVITTPASPIQAWVVPVDEEGLICRDTWSCLQAGPPRQR
jgi:acetate kinase